MLASELSDFPEELLHQRPAPAANTVGWNAWHLLRIWDYDLNWVILGQDQLADAWQRHDFTARSGYNPDGKGSDEYGLGSRYRDAEVDELTPISKTLLLEYLETLLDETRTYLREADAAELGREVRTPVHPDAATTTGVRIRHTIEQAWMHLGELRYAKGLLGYPEYTYRIANHADVQQ